MVLQTHSRRFCRGSWLLTALALGSAMSILASACGSESEAADDDPQVVALGADLEVELTDDVDENQTAGSSEPEADEDDPSSDDGAAGATTTTLPVTEEEEADFEGVQSAAGLFNQCLTVEGFEFIGRPGDPTNPATNDQDYIDALVKCAAESRIVEALEDADTAIADDPEAIQERNEGWLAFRDCLIDLGWTVPEPVPDANGLLFRIGDFADPDFAAGFFGPDGEPFGQDNPAIGECQNTAALDDDS